MLKICLKKIITLGLLLPLAWAALAGDVSQIDQQELLQRLKNTEHLVLLDVRTQAEFDAGHIQGAINIPFNELAARHGEMATKTNQEVIVYCASGRRAQIAETILSQSGYQNLRDLQGHMNGWMQSRLPVER